MSSGTLDGNRITHARTHVPAWGLWYADAELDDEVELEGEVNLVIGDLTLQGAILAGGPWKGSSNYRIVAGAGGWNATIDGRDYSNDAGVKLSTVLLDAARDAGETFDASSIPSKTIGPKFTREAGPAARVLEQLVPENWYVGEDGITRIGRRPTVELTATAARKRVDLARGVVELAGDDIATILPGVVVDGIEALDVEHDLSPRALKSKIWGKGHASSSRRLAALRKLVRQLLPDYRFNAVYEYRVVKREGDRLNLQPVRVSLGMPTLRRVKVRPGVAGAVAEVALGSLVLVAFVNADPGRPVVVGFDDVESAFFAPTRLDLVTEDDLAAGVPNPAGRSLRYGDIVKIPVVGSFAVGVIVGDPATAVSYSRVRP